MTTRAPAAPRRAFRLTVPGWSGLTASRRREALQGLAFISPWVVGFIAFTAYPMLASLYYSFTNYKGLGSPRWIGLTNYIYAFTGDPLFWLSLRITLVWVLITVPLGIIGSLLAAVLLNRGLRGMAFYRTAFFLPSLTPIVAATLLWQWILNPDIGIINATLEGLTGVRGPKWLADPDWALWSLAIIALWTSIGGSRMLIFLAALQGVPQEIYDAAKIDGANPLQSLWRITVPLITPAIFFNLVLGVIASFRVFAFAYVATAGGPARATYFYALHLYTMSFASFDLGYGSALAWVLFVLVLVITVFNIQISKRWVYYEGAR